MHITTWVVFFVIGLAVMMPVLMAIHGIEKGFETRDAELEADYFAAERAWSDAGEGAE